MKNHMSPALLGVAVVTVIFGMTYTAIQQTLRQGANDPQIQMAEDAATKLTHGFKTSDVVVTQTPGTQPDKSLAPFIMIYDPDGKFVDGNTGLGGAPFVPPLGMLEAAKADGEHRVTWQPTAEARIAAVVVPYTNDQGVLQGYVVAGRSLREVELRENQVLAFTAIGWLASLILIVVSLGWIQEKTKR